MIRLDHLLVPVLCFPAHQKTRRVFYFLPQASNGSLSCVLSLNNDTMDWLIWKSFHFVRGRIDCGGSREGEGLQCPRSPARAIESEHVPIRMLSGEVGQLK